MAAAILLVWSAAAFLAPSIAEARCRIPRIHLSAPSGERGASLTITGEFFYAVCLDFGGAPPMQPAKNIQIVFVQDNKSQLLATVDAESDLKFSLKVTVPANAAPGAATIISVAWDPKVTQVADYDLPPPRAFVVTDGSGTPK